MNKYHDVQKVLFQDDVMLLTVDGQEYSFPLTSLPKRLRSASCNRNGKPSKSLRPGMASTGHCWMKTFP